MYIYNAYISLPNNNLKPLTIKRTHTQIKLNKTTKKHSNFDFRAPENYLFLPDWMFKALRLRPRDVVSLKFVRLPGGFPTSRFGTAVGSGGFTCARGRSIESNRPHAS